MTNEVDFLDAATVLRFLSMMNGNISDGTPNGAPAYPLSTTSNINQGNVGDRSQEGPRIVITEQPASKSLRFRYECEGRSAGSIPGVNSTPENKTFPTIKIEGFKGNAVIVVSCVTKDEPHRAHPHNLVGKDGCKNGIYTVEIKDDSMTAVFPNLGIQCVKRKDIEEALKLREKIRVDPFRQGFAHKNQPSSIDLNAVRLCFQAFLRDGKTKKIIHVPSPVVSEPIFDKKAMSDLVITKLSHSSAPAKGGQEMILLCEKVAKEDIQVYFYEERNGNIVWEQYGEFQPGHVHKQVAISFKTPQYNGHIKAGHKAKVNIQLKRPSDGAVSEPLPFAFTPEDASGLKRKRPNEDNLDESLPSHRRYSLSPQPQEFLYTDVKKECVSPCEPFPNSPESSQASPGRYQPMSSPNHQHQYHPVMSYGNEGSPLPPFDQINPVLSRQDQLPGGQIPWMGIKQQSSSQIMYMPPVAEVSEQLARNPSPSNVMLMPNPPMYNVPGMNNNTQGRNLPTNNNLLISTSPTPMYMNTVPNEINCNQTRTSTAVNSVPMPIRNSPSFINSGQTVLSTNLILVDNSVMYVDNGPNVPIMTDNQPRNDPGGTSLDNIDKADLVPDQLTETMHSMSLSDQNPDNNMQTDSLTRIVNEAIKKL